MARKPFLIASGLLLAATSGAWWYSAPYRTLHALNTALEESNAQAFNAYIDYPALRESIKAQLIAQAQGPSDQQAGNELPNPQLSGAGLAMLGKMVDAVVTPETVESVLAVSGSSQALPLPLPGAATNAHEALEQLRENVSARTAYRGLDRFALTLQHSQTPDQLVVILAREGLADWKVAGVELPNLNGRGP